MRKPIIPTPISESVNHTLNPWGKILRVETPIRQEFKKYMILDHHSIFVILDQVSSGQTSSSWTTCSFTLPVVKYIKDTSGIMLPIQK